MGDEWVEREAGYFTRFEARMVALEYQADDHGKRLDKIEPVVDELRDKDMLAEAIATKVDAKRGVRLSYVVALAAVCAIFVTPLVSAVVSHYLFPPHVHTDRTP